MSDDDPVGLGRLRDCWYVACPASELGHEPRELLLAGRRSRLWRDPAGRPVTDPGGPWLTEASHYVWACPGREPAAPPPLPPLARAGYHFTQRTVRVEASHRLVLENSLDFSHGAFVHAFTQPAWLLHHLPGLPALDTTYRATSDGLALEGRVAGYLAYEHVFSLPDRLRLVLLPGSALAVEVLVHHVPESERRCRMEVLVARRAWPLERPGPRFRAGELLLHRQDIRIVEAQQRALDQGPALREEHCAADAYTLLLRHVLAQAVLGAWPGAGLPAPREVRLRV